MCRVIYFYTEKNDKPILKDLLKSFIKASEEDPYLYSLTEKREKSHNDGWGYVLVTLGTEDPSIIHYKTKTPVFRDEKGLKQLMDLIEEDNGIVTGLIHSRKASKGNQTTLIDVHPYHETSIDGSELWLAHNGSIDKQKISDGNNLERSDSYYLLKHLSSFKKSDIPLELKRLAKTTTVKGGYNLGILAVSSYSTDLMITVYNPRYENKAYYNYLKMYEIRGDNSLFVVSSTIHDYYRNYYEGHAIDITEIENGKLIIVEIRINQSIIKIMNDNLLQD